MSKIDGKLRAAIAKEIKDRQAAAWERLDKSSRIDIIQWADLADDLDAMIDDIIEYFQPEDGIP